MKQKKEDASDLAIIPWCCLRALRGLFTYIMNNEPLPCVLELPVSLQHVVQPRGISEEPTNSFSSSHKAATNGSSAFKQMKGWETYYQHPKHRILLKNASHGKHFPKTLCELFNKSTKTGGFASQARS